MKRIGVVLPSRESFGLAKSGAVALCARDFQAHSRFQGRIDIVGAGTCEYPEVAYLRIENWRRWWRRDRTAYADAVAAALRDHALIEGQNRPPMMLRLRRRLPGAKLALHLHNDPQTMDGARTAAERERLLAVCDAVYCVSDFVRRRFLEGIGEAETVVVAPNGIAAPPAAAKERIGAFVGRVIAVKGVVELARAFAAAELTGWRLVVAGGDPEGLLRGLGVEALGQVSHAQAMDLLARAEIAAVPSLWDEPFGRAAIEGMAAGVALIASRRGALEEVCGEAAVYVEPEESQDFARALRRLALDEAHRREMQARARARAAQFEIGAATARLDAVRARLLGEA